MITLGIDLSSRRNYTAACRIEWNDDGSFRIAQPENSCDDEKLDELIAQATVVGIDAPFGWPDAFVNAVAHWTATTWTSNEPLQKSLRLRATDIFVNQKTKLCPLSVSTDQIALPAMRAMSLLKRREVVDKSGAGRDAGGRQYFEVYPAGSLRRWDLLQKGYKGSSDEAAKRRKKIFVGLSKVLPTAEIPKAYAKIDHAFDSLIASLTARAAALSRTLWPDETQRKSAINEGWIHLPAGENVAACVK